MRTKRIGTLLLFSVICALVLAAGCARQDEPTPTPGPGPGGTPPPVTGDPSDTSLDSCPAREPVLRIAMVTGSEDYTSHPAESRFSGTHFARLHQVPLFGVDPLEEDIDTDYGVAESWEFHEGATGMTITIKEGLTFNDGSPITAEDVAFSIDLAASPYADDQVSGALNGIGVTATAVDERTVELQFEEGAVTFDIEMSPLVFPLYVTSREYHSNGEISQEAFDAFRANPLAAGPYRVVSRQPESHIYLEADRRDPLLGCPVYDRIEIRQVRETGTRMAQFRTGEQDIITGSRDLVGQAEGVNAQVFSKPAAHMIGLYIFQTWHEHNVFHDEDVRKAAAYAIDKELIMNTIWGGIGVEPWGCTWPPSTEISTELQRYMDACGTPYPYDPDMARQHLAAAGYPEGQGPTIRLEYSNSYPEEGDLAEAMQPMLNAVGFNAIVEPYDRAERDRRRDSGEGHIDGLLFFGPGGRITSLAGSYSVWGPDLNWGPRHDEDVVAALTRASRAGTLEDYMEATADLGELIYDRAYGPGFFAAGSIFFAQSDIPDWGLERSRGRGPMNLAALVTQR